MYFIAISKISDSANGQWSWFRLVRHPQSRRSSQATPLISRVSPIIVACATVGPLGRLPLAPHRRTSNAARRLCHCVSPRRPPHRSAVVRAVALPLRVAQPPTAPAPSSPRASSPSLFNTH
ncbi:hypothetical protein U1Q18_039202 [Sarracenia purpurea var. burkii]